MLGRAAAGALLFATSCVRVEAYTCTDESECLSRAGGICEPTGYCSYPDAECASQQRYSALAGPFAGECTDAPSTTTSTATTSLSSTSSSSSSSSEESDDPMRITGETDPPPMSGDLIDSFTHDGVAGGADVFWAVEAIGSEFVVAGYEHVEGTGRDVLLTRYTRSGDVRWTLTRDRDGGTDQASAMVRGGDGTLYVAGQHEVGGSVQPWAHRWSSSGVEKGEPIELTGMSAWGIAYGPSSYLAVVGRSSTTAGFGALLRTWGEIDSVFPFASPPAAALLDTVALGSDFFVAGRESGAAYVGRMDGKGVHEVVRLSDARFAMSELQGIVVTPDAIFVVGWVSTLDAATQGFVASYELDGSMRWETIAGGEGNDELEAVLVRDDDVIGVGFSLGAEDHDVWVGSWSRDAGQELWSSTYPEIEHGDGIARAVTELEGELLVVGEVQGPNGDLDGFALRLVP
jgi:hypothetical protein